MQQSQSRSLVDWLSYLEQIHPVNIDMGLERVGAVARRMGLTRLPFKVITVAGTNGKGSSCAMAASILMAAGYKVGSTPRRTCCALPSGCVSMGPSSLTASTAPPLPRWKPLAAR